MTRFDILVVDALYREEEEAVLRGDVPYRTAKFGFRKRDVWLEAWIL
ncbi:MAG: hypothetical protein LYZ69_09355 [Nitrososphaerales archaeon]|nr:hypothetical protein [Nitrososphaerales archaeon]